MPDHVAKKLHIYHIISGDLWAGAETMAYNLLSCLKEFPDLELSVILLNEGMLADKLRNLGISVHIINENLFSLWEIIAKIRTIFRNCNPDLIHSHRYKENFLAFLVTLFQRKINLITTQHGLPEQLAKKPGIIHRLKMFANFFLLSRYFITVAVSNDIGNILIRHFGFNREKIEVIHNGIAIPDPCPQRAGNENFIIGSSGRLFPVKDFPLMVNIAGTISSSHMTGVHFELAGDGPEMPKLEALVNSYGLSADFIFRGHQDDMDSFYRGLDIYLNTSIHEGIPMTILEAFSHGLPVIAPAVGGIVEIIVDGVDGFLVKSRNPLDFAEKCLLLREDSEMRQRMSRAAREKAEMMFSANRMAENYHRLYLDRCSNPENAR